MRSWMIKKHGVFGGDVRKSIFDVDDVMNAAKARRAAAMELVEAKDTEMKESASNKRENKRKFGDISLDKKSKDESVHTFIKFYFR